MIKAVFLKQQGKDVVTFTVKLDLNWAVRLCILFFKLARPVSLVFVGRPFQPHGADVCWDSFMSATFSSRPDRQGWATLETLSPEVPLAAVLTVSCGKWVKTPPGLSSSPKSSDSDLVTLGFPVSFPGST